MRYAITQFPLALFNLAGLALTTFTAIFWDRHLYSGCDRCR